MLIGCMVTVQLICVFDFQYAKSVFSKDRTYMSGVKEGLNLNFNGLVSMIP